MNLYHVKTIFENFNYEYYVVASNFENAITIVNLNNDIEEKIIEIKLLTTETLMGE